jgi:hypothetical protein
MRRGPMRRKPTRPPGSLTHPSPSTWFGVFDGDGTLIATDRVPFNSGSRPHHGAHPSRVILHSDFGSFLVYADYKRRGIWIVHAASGHRVVGPRVGRVAYDLLPEVLGALEKGIEEHGLVLLGFIRDGA